MKRRTWIVAALGLGAISALGLGCGNKAAATPEWRVGAYLSLSGAQTQFGQDTREGIELAMDEVNKAGGVRGKPIKLLIEDDKSSQQEATNKVLQLIDRDKVVALLGEVASSISKAAGIVANRRKVPMISPSSTNPDVTRVGPFVFRVCFTDDAQGQAGARFVASTLKKKKVAILYATDNLYSAGLASYFRDEAKKLGLEVVGEKGFLKSETNFTTYITELRDAKPDIIYAPIYYNAMIPIARQAKAAGVKGDMFIGGDGWHSEALVTDAGEEMEGAYLTDHFAPDVPLASSKAFVAQYRGALPARSLGAGGPGLRRRAPPGGRHRAGQGRQPRGHPRRHRRDQGLPRRDRLHHHQRGAERGQANRLRADQEQEVHLPLHHRHESGQLGAAPPRRGLARRREHGDGAVVERHERAGGAAGHARRPRVAAVGAEHPVAHAAHHPGGRLLQPPPFVVANLGRLSCCVGQKGHEANFTALQHSAPGEAPSPGASFALETKCFLDVSRTLARRVRGAGSARHRADVALP